MKRLLIPIILAIAASTAHAQTLLRLSNVTLTEQGDVHRGADVTAVLRGDQGKKSVVVHAGQRHEVTGKFKVKTHNVRRQSVKQGAVYSSPCA